MIKQIYRFDVSTSLNLNYPESGEKCGLALINREQGPPEIIVIDPDYTGQIASNYTEVFGGVSINFLRMKFSESINSGVFDQVINS